MVGTGGARPTPAFMLPLYLHEAEKTFPCTANTEARRGISFTGGRVALSGRRDTPLYLSGVMYKALFGLTLQFVS